MSRPVTLGSKPGQKRTTATMASAAAIRQVKLDKECELRVEVSESAPLRLRVLNGRAEIFGTEIPPEIWLSFPPRLKFAVSTYFSNFSVGI